MEKQDIITFFDRCAPTWDAEMVKSDEIIGKILDNAEVGPGMDVLDVACGTGVLFPYYLERNVASVTGIDISPEMAKIAEGKYPGDDRVRVICGDVEESPFLRRFDRIVVYNAFPHFPNPERLIRVLSGLLKQDGRLTIAHGASRAAIDNHHSSGANRVSCGLMEAERLVRLFAPYFNVEVMISNRFMYQVSGVLRRSGEEMHTHSHTHSHTAAALEQTPEELYALLNYMVHHNDAHAQEAAELACGLLKADKPVAYARVMDAVSDFDVANAKLAAALETLKD